jgi:hypothetical protein
MKKKYYMKPDVQIIRAYEPEHILAGSGRDREFDHADGKRRFMDGIDTEAMQPQRFEYKRFEPWSDYKDDDK